MILILKFGYIVCGNAQHSGTMDRTVRAAPALDRIIDGGYDDGDGRDDDDGGINSYSIIFDSYVVSSEDVYVVLFLGSILHRKRIILT